jgi:hypothetical protein
MPTPNIEFDGATYTVTLFRGDHKEYFVFGDHILSVCSAREDQCEPSERSQINAEPDAEGLLYYIHAQPRDLSPAERVALKDKEEAHAINLVLLFLEENEEAVNGADGDDHSSSCDDEVYSS